MCLNPSDLLIDGEQYDFCQGAWQNHDGRWRGFVTYNASGGTNPLAAILAGPSAFGQPRMNLESKEW